METAALMRCTILRNIISSLEQPLDTPLTAAIAQQLVENCLLSAGPDGTQGGLWAPVTELQGKLMERLLKHITKGEASFRPGAAILLGLVCRHVPARPFLASYGEWAAALIELIRRDSEPVPKAGALRALSDLFTRIRELLEVPGVRRDSSSIAGRTLQVATPLLVDSACQVSALAAVHSVLQAVPTVARNHTGPLERNLAGLMAAPSSRLDVRCSAAVALALLPRAAADDAAAWSILIRRVLLSLHTAIDLLLYHGGGIAATAGGGAAAAVTGVAPDGGLAERAREHLEASGLGVADAEGLLGSAGFVSGGSGCVGSAAALAARPGVTLTVQVMSALLHCLVNLVGRGSTSPVPVPSHAILLLVMRMLKVDAAVLLAPGRTAPSASAQSAVLAVLPDLHVSGWELLELTARVTRSTMMPLMALVGRLLGEHLRRIKAGGAGGLAVTMPAPVRTSLYRTTTAVLRVGGFAAGRYLAFDIVGMLITELYGLSATQQQEKSKALFYGSGLDGAGRAPAAGASQLPAKRAKITSDPLAAFDAAAAAAAAAAIAPLASAVDVKAQVAALEVAEALLQVYGPALSADLRGQLDALSYHMAAVLAEAAYRVSREPGTAAGARVADVASLRVAATRTLIASLAAPWPSRHPFLSDGLQLLSSGASGAEGVALAQVCSEGLLALEALLRPRSVAPWTVARTGSTAADAMQGTSLPRPRLWSMFDPVQPRLPALPATAVVPTPVAAAAVDKTAAANDMAVDQGSCDVLTRQIPASKVAQPAANGAQEMEVGTAEDYKAGSGDEDRKVLAASTRTAAVTPVPVAARAPLEAAQRKCANDNKGKVEGKSPAPAFAGLVSRAGDKAPRGKAAEAAAAAAALDAMEVDDVAQSAPAQVQQRPTTAVAELSSRPGVQGRSGVPAATAPVLGEESDDSEGSLPEIDSGNDNDDSDDE
ncbi:hypothetical protein Vretimale_18532 [Volvox reticuliferus]|uniref:Pre-rRNA-processing protein RIX1 N-terminal domain-containing protein n=1 Tax=Volvox reticuliferus TaxID=1737510 RepID=A0A8J4LZF6_9CHLO|nr:hypothetical protein Vretimale_18532 [Volvox reticuliferus]